MLSIFTDPSFLRPAVATLRIGIVLAWGLIGLWGFWAFFKLMVKDFDNRDILWAAMGMLAFALEIGNVGTITHVRPEVFDKWTFNTLLSLFLSAVGLIVFRCYQAPDGHKRSALLAHFAMLTFLVIAGLLS